MEILSGSALHRRGGYGYFEWLCIQVGIHDGWHPEKEDLLWQLHSIDFRFSIPTDINRRKDALKLRDLYLDSRRTPDSESTYINAWPVSVLEILVALAKRCAEDVLGDNSNGDLFRELFWDMIANLGLMRFNSSKGDRGKICTIIEIWINRDFEADGGGSPFPLKRPPMDQRRVEIWEQMCNYLNEHQEIEGF